MGIEKLRALSENSMLAAIAPPLLIALLAIVLQQSSVPRFYSDDLQVLLGMLIALSVSIITFIRWHQTGKTPRIWLLLLIGSYVWLASEIVDSLDYPSVGIISQNGVAIGVWLLTLVAILPAIGRGYLTPAAKSLLTLGLIFQTVSFIFSMARGSLFRISFVSIAQALNISEDFEALALATYASSLIMILILIALEISKSTGRLLWDVINTTPGRAIGIIGEDVSWLFWKLSNPRAPFSKFYADSIERKLNRGRPHKTLGQYAFSRDSVIVGLGDRIKQFPEEGLNKYNYIAQFLRSPDDTVVDYGCGSLRIGQHFIKSQVSHRFWGLDVTDRFYNDGLALIPPEVVDTKQPQFRKIDASSLAEVRASEPDLLYSVAVMKHVPPGELEVYWQNMLGLLRPGATAVIYGEISDTGIRNAAKNWAHSRNEILAIIERFTPGVSVEIEISGGPMFFAGKRIDPTVFILRMNNKI